MNAYQKLKEYKEKYPELTFDNKGYQYLKPNIRESHKEVIKEIENILKEEIKGFAKFFNFKPRIGTFDIRCDYNWDAHNGRTFIGVGYFNIEEFK